MFRDRRLISILAAIVVLRLWFAFTFPIVQISDYKGYYDGALAIAGVTDPRLSPWDPLAPKLLYALPLRLASGDVRVLGLVNAFLFTMGVSFLLRAVTLAFDRMTAFVCGLLSIVSLSDLYFNNLACTEILAAASLNLLFLLMVRPSRERGLVLVGVVIGLATYNRSNMMSMGFVVLAIEMFRNGVVRGFRRTASAGIAAVVVLIPLCFFNLTTFGRFTPLTANAGIQAWYGNNPNAAPGSHRYEQLPEEFPVGSAERARRAAAYRSFFPTAGQNGVIDGSNLYRLSDLGARYASAWIRANRQTYVEFCAARLRGLYSQCTYGVAPYLFYDATLTGQPRWSEWARAALLGKDAPARSLDGPANPITPLNRFVGSWYKVLAAGALLGGVLTLLQVCVKRSGWDQLIPLLIVVVYTLPFVLTIGLNRYHVPVMGLMWVYLSRALVLALGYVRGRPFEANSPK